MNPYYEAERLTILHGNALELQLPDDSVDLVVTSPPYFGLRSYQDGGEHYDGQIGDETTPAEFVDALVAATAEMMRVVKPSGSIWVNLGDKYAPTKSLIGVPWRYALRCIDDLGLILRAEVIWSKPNGLPESVTDRVRRSHEQWFHFTLEQRYFSAVDEIREPHLTMGRGSDWETRRARLVDRDGYGRHDDVLGMDNAKASHPLGKLPGSVWTVPTQPLQVPASLGIDHFAAFPMEWPRRIITGWSPAGVCVECGEGRRPVAGRTAEWDAYKKQHGIGDYVAGTDRDVNGKQRSTTAVPIPAGPKTVITGYACACDEPTADTRHAVVLDPFGGTGTTALVAWALGRHGISNDLSTDYCRLAQWRCTDPGQRAAAMQVDKPDPISDDQLALIEISN